MEEIELLIQRVLYEIQTGIVIAKFQKKDGSIRKMICTRNVRIAEYSGCEVPHLKLESRDAKANFRETGILPVIDLVVGDVRMMNFNSMIKASGVRGVDNEADYCRTMLGLTEYVSREF